MTKMLYALLCPHETQRIVLYQTRLIQAPSTPFVNTTPLRPGLFLFNLTKFLERGNFCGLFLIMIFIRNPDVFSKLASTRASRTGQFFGS